jgi:hypothetical protein
MSTKATKKEDTKAKEVAKPVAKTETAKVEVPVGGGVMDNLTSKQAFKKFSYRGEDINKLLALNMDELAYLFN